MFPDRMHAVFSEDRLYRYSLLRIWRPDGHRVNFVMLNPSKADEVNDDPTIRRCINCADAWGFGGLIVTNLFGLRATDPRLLKQAPDPVGPENDRYLLECAQECTQVVCAWGVHGVYKDRSRHVRDLFRSHFISPAFLSLTKQGHPGHPLYLSGSLKPIPWIA